MVCFTLALALFQQDSYDDVAEHLAGGVPELGGSIPNKSSFTRARQRLGAQAIEGVFRKLAGPLAPAGLAGSFYRGMRLAAVDGFVLDAPETKANRRRLGGPKDARGQVAGFPQVRVVTLTETGTHAHLDAAVDGVCPAVVRCPHGARTTGSPAKPRLHLRRPEDSHHLRQAPPANAPSRL